jgi:hypothetical protein
MKRPIVHIGYHKTGTTWFQQRFYPRVVGRYYIGRRLVRQAFLAPHALHFDGAAARQALGGGLGGIIICEENLSGGLHHGGLAGCQSKDVAERIRAALPDAQIVIFVRRQIDAVASAYVQYVKGGGTFGVERYLFGRDYYGPNAPEHDEVPRFRFEHFAYDRLISHYDGLFGRASVHVYRYEDFRADPRSFIQAFMVEHGLSAPLDDMDFGTANNGLSGPLLATARLANRFTRRAVADKSCLVHLPGWYKLSRRLIRGAAARGLGGRPLGASDILAPPLRAAIENLYRDSNAALARRIGKSWECSSRPDARIVDPPRWRRLLQS